MMQKSALIKIVLMLGIIYLNTSKAQINPVQPDPKDGSNFFTLQEAMNDYYEKNPGVRGLKQWKRKEWFLEPRLYPSGKMENLTLKTWKEYDSYMKTLPNDRSTHGSWSFLGPSFNEVGLGRLNAIAFHPTIDNIMYVGSANGGVWKTINGGVTWTNISPSIPLLSIADIKLSPTNPNVIYILTGDGDPLVDQFSFHSQCEVGSIGILMSTDAGATWYPTNYSFGSLSLLIPTKLLIHPTNPNIQYVANEFGIHRTTDHWANWTTEIGDVIFDIEFKPDNPNIMYASGDDEILKSTDGGDTWTQITDSDFNFIEGGRIELAIAPSNVNVVYALAGTINGMLGFFQSTNQGNNNSWTLQTTAGSELGTFTNYCVALAVDPGDHTDVFGGMQWISRSFNQGVTWDSCVDNEVHADVHDVAYENGALWVCCDGGLYKSTDEGNNWTDLTNGMAITEIYRVAGTPQHSEIFFIGAQDNGTMRRFGSTSSFDPAYGGDGMTPMIDYTDYSIVYASSQYGSFAKSTSSGAAGTFTNLSVPDPGAWISPAVMDPADPEVLFVGTGPIWRSDNGGDDWEWIGTPTTSNTNCLAQGTSNTNRLYASAMEFIFRTDNAKVTTGQATWTNIGAGLPNVAITGIAVDPDNSLRVFVTLSAYLQGEKVFKSENGGSTWINISGSLPNIPANCIRFHDDGSGNDHLYIGTDIGVFYRNNTLGDWVYFSNQLPAVTINDLYIHVPSGSLIAATYGRGLWRSTLYTGCSSTLTLTTSAGSPAGGLRYYSSSNTISSSAEYRKDIGTSVHYKALNSINLISGFNAGAIGFFEAKLGPCPDIYHDPFNSPYVPSGKFCPLPLDTGTHVQPPGGTVSFLEESGQKKTGSD